MWWRSRRGRWRLGADLTIETGGEVLLPGAQASTSITRASGGSTPSLFVHGRLAVPREDGDPCYFRVNTVSVPVELRPGGLIETLDGEVYLIGGGSWTGGTVRAASRCGGRLVFGGIDVTTFIAGDVVARAEQDGRVLFAGLTHTLNVIGTLRTEDLGDAGQTGIEVENVIAIGTGEIRHEQGRMLMHGCDMGTTLINSAELQLAGGASDVRGLLRNDVDVRQYSGLRFEGGVAENTGVWSVEGSGGNQAVGSGGLFTNTGVYMVGDPDGPSFGHNAAVRFDNRGSVVVDEADAVFRDVVQIVGNELTGGDWDVVTTGSITFPGLTVSRVTGQGTRVRGDAASQPWGSDVETIDGGARVESVGDWSFGQPLTIDDGTLEALSGTTMAPKIDIEGSGTLGVGDGAKVKSDDDLDLHSVLGDIQGVIAPGLLPAPATIEAPDTRSHGRVIPGGIARAGQFDFVGDLTLFDDGQLLVDVGGADNTDVITVAGSATLGGTLRVSLIDGFVPEGGESYRLIDTLGGIFNDFAAADLPELPTGLEWEVYVGELFVGLSVVDGCQADWNGDGSVNTQDFLAYLNDWNVQRVMDCSGGVCSADLNGDGTVNTQDFLLFLNFWTSGC
ncbi:MAG: hypothetical protein HND58_01430 [Planctomycetota bacterium]|nr:MAG: hypothetical protein HND58_01430 [Planctomycetota bacterium]